MSDSQVKEGTESTEGESAVLSNIRKENRDLQKQLKVAVEKLETVSEQVAETRSAQAKQHVEAAGYEGFDVTIVLDRIEGEVTEDSVTKALQAMGLGVTETVEDGKTEDDAKGETDDGPSAPGIGQRVAQAAKGSGDKSFEAELGNTKSAEDVAELMESHGATTSYV